MRNNTIRIALAGNPNSGKTTLFNALTGAHHKVGNYPGVTVEKREGSVIHNGKTFHFIDLPGIYSLTAYSMDEVVARDFILDEKPDLIVDVLDSTNLQRHLYLCLQMQELGIPVIGALNMTDEADENGIRINEKQLSASLGLPFVKITAHKSRGINDLLSQIEETASNSDGHSYRHNRNLLYKVSYGEEIENRLVIIEKLIKEGGASVDNSDSIAEAARWLSVKLLEKDKNAEARLSKLRNFEEIKAAAATAISWIQMHFGKDAEIVISEQRYGYIRGAVKESLSTIPKVDFSLTEKTDKVIMNRFLALPIFVAVLYLIFQLTFTIGAYPQGWLETFFGFLSGVINTYMPESLFRSLLVDGIIAGAGGVLSFVPLIVLLFFFLSILEDIGYMSRASFATDRFLHTFGLHGQSIFPMMLGFGCSVPAIMASRTLKSQRDRILTVLITPMMSCGAKLPIHILFAAAFFPGNAANMVMLIYACGIVISLISALILKKTALKGDPTPFVMELPPYRAPTAQGVLWHVWEKTWHYISRAGTIILASAVLIWIITNFPVYSMQDSETEAVTAAFQKENPNAGDAEIAAHLETLQADAVLEHSVAGTIGHVIEPVFRPLGFNWKMAVATVTGFAAKEIVVSTLGILYRVGMEEDEESESLHEALQNDPSMTPLTGFVFMLFMLLIPPCFAALATIKAELGWKWLGFEFVFLLCTGWISGCVVYQIGKLFAGL
ncbi:ferrous iron transport protein B [Spirochaetia bacterium]|nr:ferrous iron transport protein B [Spirochaetia bacterium]